MNPNSAPYPNSFLRPNWHLNQQLSIGERSKSQSQLQTKNQDRGIFQARWALHHTCLLRKAVPRLRSTWKLGKMLTQPSDERTADEPTIPDVSGPSAHQSHRLRGRRQGRDLGWSRCYAGLHSHHSARISGSGESQFLLRTDISAALDHKLDGPRRDMSSDADLHPIFSGRQPPILMPGGSEMPARSVGSSSLSLSPTMSKVFVVAGSTGPV
jgi:hypothetical protein